MKIQDLNHIEVVIQDVVGGVSYPSYMSSAKARASADALTIGRNTFSSTYTRVYAIAGWYASSRSRSYASAK